MGRFTQVVFHAVSCLYKFNYIKYSCKYFLYDMSGFNNMIFSSGLTSILLLPSEENFDSHNHCSFLSKCCPRINVFAIKFVKLLKLKMITYFTAPTSWFLFRSNELWGEIGHICQEDRKDILNMGKITSLISCTFVSFSELRSCYLGISGEIVL